MTFFAEKTCNMHTLLKYAKMRQYTKCVAIAYLHKADMPNYYGLFCISRTFCHCHSENCCDFFLARLAELII